MLQLSRAQFERKNSERISHNNPPSDLQREHVEGAHCSSQRYQRDAAALGVLERLVNRRLCS